MKIFFGIHVIYMIYKLMRNIHLFLIFFSPVWIYSVLNLMLIEIFLLVTLMLKVFIGQSVLGRSDTFPFIEPQIAELDMSNKLEICLHHSLDSYALINYFFSSSECSLLFKKAMYPVNRTDY